MTALEPALVPVAGACIALLRLRPAVFAEGKLITAGADAGLRGREDATQRLIQRGAEVLWSDRLRQDGSKGYDDLERMLVVEMGWGWGGVHRAHAGRGGRGASVGGRGATHSS